MKNKRLLAALLTIIFLCSIFIPGIQTVPEYVKLPRKTYIIELNTPIVGIKLSEPQQTEPSKPTPPQLEIPLSEELQQYTYQRCEYDNELYFLVIAIMKQESNFKLDAISKDGHDFGPMQIRDNNLEELEKQFGPIDLMNPFDNIKCGVYKIKKLIHKYEYKNLALMAYNCGETGAKRIWRQGIYSTEYSRKVTEYYNCYAEGAVL